MRLDGSGLTVIVTRCRHRDGIVVDTESGHIYWTDMGVPNLNDGSIERADVDGQNRKTIVPWLFAPPWRFRSAATGGGQY
jgi:hypothetical protein